MTSAGAASVIENFDDLTEDIIKGHGEALAGKRVVFRRFIRRPSTALTYHDAHRTARRLASRLMHSKLTQHPYWASAVIKPIVSRRRRGLVCTVLAVENWRELAEYVRSPAVLPQLLALVKSVLRHRPYAIVVYANNTAVAFFCTDACHDSQRIIAAVRKAAHQEHGERIEFGEMRWSPEGVGYSFIAEKDEMTMEPAEDHSSSKMLRPGPQKRPSGITFLGLRLSGGRYPFVLNVTSLIVMVGGVVSVVAYLLSIDLGALYHWILGWAAISTAGASALYTRE